MQRGTGGALGLLALLLLAVALAQDPVEKQQLQEASALGLQGCVDGFVVHRDKIIRTQDSRDMGAKYLTEFDVDSRLECMKWCCETEHCDVFIFEEKKPGSCYLFHCGPPHDFKCKFTSHANYSSAVLTNYNVQSAAALEEQIRRNQQEHELKSLRQELASFARSSDGREGAEDVGLDLSKPPARNVEPSPKEYNEFTPMPATTSTTSPPAPSPTPATAKLPTCSHNQFECRSSGDCIAIYNVCDGIPQCADGSDEAAELSCPADRTTAPPPPPPPPPPVAQTPQPYVVPLLPDVVRYQQMMQQQQQHAQYPMIYGGAREQELAKSWPVHQLGPAQEMGYGSRGYGPQQAAPVLQSPEEPLRVSGSGPGVARQQPPGYQWNGYQAPLYEAGPSKIASNTALDPMHAQNAIPNVYDQPDQQTRIFNHKGPGMRNDEMEAANRGVYAPDPNRGYAPYYPAVIHHPDAWQEGNPPQPMREAVPTPAPPREQPFDEAQRQPLTSSTSPPPCEPPQKAKEATKAGASGDERPASEEARKRPHSSEPRAKDSGDKRPEKPRQSQPAAEHAASADHHKAHETELRSMADSHQQEHKVQAVAEHIRSHVLHPDDPEMSRPKGAVISLALGLSVTAVMAVLIACRLRVVKRRGRGRGHDSFAHDADYLVNGMYL